MKHSLPVLIGAALLAVGTGCASTSAPHAATSSSADAMAMAADDPMMAKMMELATPGPEHALLMKSVGHWEHTLRMRMAPDAPWTETASTSDIEPLLGGRYVMEHMKFELMGMPMEGLSITGFDNMTGEYTSMWADTMGTWWVSSRGKPGADGVIHFAGTMVDVAGTRPFRMDVTYGNDTSRFEMFDTIPPKGDVLVMTGDGKKVGGKR